MFLGFKSDSLTLTLRHYCSGKQLLVAFEPDAIMVYLHDGLSSRGKG